MRPTFKIEPARPVTAASTLLVEISQHGMTYVVLDGDKEAVALCSYHFEGPASADRAAALLKELAADEAILQEEFKKTIIVYAYPAAITVPQEFAGESVKKEMLELVHGDITDAFIRSDFVYHQNMYSIYAVPRQVDAVVSYLFSRPVSTHLYSLLPEMFAADGGSHLYCVFNPSSFTVMLLKNNKLQVIQTYQFKAPEDVAYYLLQLCEAFESDVNATTVHLNGMIDSTSSLYAALHKYFSQIQFAVLPEAFTYPKEIHQHPSHYFSHLFAAALCV